MARRATLQLGVTLFSHCEWFWMFDHTIYFWCGFFQIWCSFYMRCFFHPSISWIANCCYTLIIYKYVYILSATVIAELVFLFSISKCRVRYPSHYGRFAYFFYIYIFNVWLKSVLHSSQSTVYLIKLMHYMRFFPSQMSTTFIWFIPVIVDGDGDIRSTKCVYRKQCDRKSQRYQKRKEKQTPIETDRENTRQTKWKCNQVKTHSNLLRSEINIL